MNKFKILQEVLFSNGVGEVCRTTVHGICIMYDPRLKTTNVTYDLAGLHGWHGERELFETVEDVKRSIIDNATKKYIAEIERAQRLGVKT